MELLVCIGLFLNVAIFPLVSTRNNDETVLEAGMAEIRGIAQKVCGEDELKVFYTTTHKKAQDFADKIVDIFEKGDQPTSTGEKARLIFLKPDFQGRSGNPDYSKLVPEGIRLLKCDLEKHFKNIYGVLGVGISYGQSKDTEEVHVLVALYVTGIEPTQDIQKLYEKDVPHSIVVLGASGDLARKKTYPALFTLFRYGYLPSSTYIFGFSGSPPNYQEVKKNCNVAENVELTELFEKFWKCQTIVKVINKYVETDFLLLQNAIHEKERNWLPRRGNRIFYFAVPAEGFFNAATQIQKICTELPEPRIDLTEGWKRLILEKPFGHSLESAQALRKQLSDLKYEEYELYRIDHFLGKNMVQNLVSLRLNNKTFQEVWKGKFGKIVSVLITCEEDIGTHKRGPYFDQYGIVRDIMQNHLMQMFSLIAMDVTNISGLPADAEKDAEKIRNAKYELLKKIKPVTLGDTQLSQYVHNPDERANLRVVYDPEQAEHIVKYKRTKDIPESVYDYVEDLPTNVAKNSKTPTFAVTILRIDKRKYTKSHWKDIPFILRCGKAMEKKKTEIRIQFPFDETAGIQKELVISVQPEARIVMRTKTYAHKGKKLLSFEDEEIDYKSIYEYPILKEAYDRLLFDVLRGSQNNMVGFAELEEAWRIVDPILNKFIPKPDTNNPTTTPNVVVPPPLDTKVYPSVGTYRFGTQGPDTSDLFKNCKFKSPNISLKPYVPKL